MNTINKGKIRFLIFQKKGEKLFTGVCLDFGIVIEGKNPVEIRDELEIAAKGYLQTILDQKMDESLLNNQAEKEYFDIYENILQSELAKSEARRKYLINNISRFDIKVSSVPQLVGC